MYWGNHVFLRTVIKVSDVLYNVCIPCYYKNQTIICILSSLSDVLQESQHDINKHSFEGWGNVPY